uniref:ciliogenesis-associated TTC17-interacting protein isoform X2 n=1 Tax=Osmia lignaria TaxID=473952 RepID=UPI001479179A|nr:ciliogenesis-associated TTC17-interacting protein isoform X2 [Osmia lignaria]
MSSEKEISCKLFDINKWIPGFLIDNVKRAALCFRETLIICLKNEPERNTKPIGGYCILVESIGPQAHEFLVHVQSSMSIDGHFGGSKVTSSATSKFHCLEEKRTEFVYDNGFHEKVIFMGIEDNNYYVKLTRICPCDKSTETKDLSFCSNDKLISEGVNILLMRYLAIINYEGTLCFESITIDGDLTVSSYTCTPMEQMEIDGHFLDVYIIERKICKQDGTTYLIKTYLTPKGRILRHNWLDVPYILRINPLADPKIPQKTMRIEAPLKDHWEEDIEMFSIYLDMKYSKTAEQKEYLADHPEVKQLIADYVQTLLVGNQFDNWNNIVSILLRQLAEERSSTTMCNICGFFIPCGVLDKASSEFEGECQEMMSSDDSAQSTRVESSNDSRTEVQEKTDTLNEISTKEQNIVYDTTLPEQEKTCDRCETMKIYNYQPSPKCPGCLRTFKICRKCSAIDKILQKLKH